VNNYSDELHDLLTLWATYMRRPDLPGGYNGRASGGLKSSASKDTDQLYGQLDRHTSEIVSAGVDSLKVHEQAAIFKAYGLSVVWRFSQLDAIDTLETARNHLRLILRKKNLLSSEYCAKMRTDGTLHVCTKRNAA
jgi:hypothetical protein